MPTFDYQALDAAGKTHRGVIEATSPRDARQQLRDQQWIPVEVHEGHSGTLPWLRGWRSRWRTLNAEQIALLTRQIGVMLDAGLPLDETLQALANQARATALKRVVVGVREAIKEGRSLSDALGQFPRVFSPLYRATITAGESAGQLASIFLQLADYLDRQRASAQQFQAALLYPILLLGFSIAVVSGLMAWVVPSLVDVILSTGQTLPILTEILIAISHGVGRYGMAIAALLLVALIGLRIALVNPEFRRRWDRAKLRWPWIGAHLAERDATRFSSTLAILSHSGIPLNRAIRIAADVTDNTWLREHFRQVANQVEEGASLTRSLTNVPRFPDTMAQLIASGERSGELATMLDKAVGLQESISQRRLKTFTTLFEPLTLLIMGLIVLGIVLAVMLPILNFNQLAL